MPRSNLEALGDEAAPKALVKAAIRNMEKTCAAQGSKDLGGGMELLDGYYMLRQALPSVFADLNRTLHLQSKIAQVTTAFGQTLHSWEALGVCPNGSLASMNGMFQLDYWYALAHGIDPTKRLEKPSLASIRCLASQLPWPLDGVGPMLANLIYINSQELAEIAQYYGVAHGASLAAAVDMQRIATEAYFDQERCGSPIPSPNGVVDGLFFSAAVAAALLAIPIPATTDLSVPALGAIAQFIPTRTDFYQCGLFFTHRLLFETRFFTQPPEDAAQVQHWASRLREETLPTLLEWGRQGAWVTSDVDLASEVAVTLKAIAAIPTEEPDLAELLSLLQRAGPPQGTCHSAVTYVFGIAPADWFWTSELSLDLSALT